MGSEAPPTQTVERLAKWCPEAAGSNGVPIGRSEMYSSKGARDNGIRSVETNAPGARVEDLID
jgi:hypothetical protein